MMILSSSGAQDHKAPLACGPSGMWPLWHVFFGLLTTVVLASRELGVRCSHSRRSGRGRGSSWGSKSEGVAQSFHCRPVVGIDHDLCWLWQERFWLLGFCLGRLGQVGLWQGRLVLG
jgi:hypothetical protein